MNYFKKTASIIALLIMSLVTASHAFAFTGSGAGTIGDPYMITDCVQLTEISFNTGASYKLANNIDCSGTSFLSMGAVNDPFTGDFDGQGYTIDVNISNVGAQYVGVFGKVTGAHIHDVRVTGSVSATGDYVAGVVASADGATVIERVVNEASVRGRSYVGGLVGFLADATITNSYNTGEVSSASGSQIGGITGFMTSYASIINSYNRGQVGRNTDAIYHLGGLTGWRLTGSIITNSFNAGAVLSGQNTFFFGGLWGNDQDGTSTPSAGLTNNFFDISRSTRTMCGYNNNGAVIIPVIGQCEGVNAGNTNIHYFKDDAANAPLTSWDFTTIWETNTDEYPSLRAITADGGVVNDDPDVTAPVISEITAITTPTRAYTQNYIFTTDEAGTIVTGGACSGEEVPATVGSNTISFGFDTGTYSDCTVRVRDAGGNLSNTINIPSFTVDHSFLGAGDGSENTPYLVTTCEELQSLQGNVGQGVHVTLGNDIDCSATATWNEDPQNPGQYFGFIPIEGIDGIFVGGGHTISGITINLGPTGKGGLFTQIDGSALVYGFNLTNMTVTGGDDHVGGLAGTIYGTVVGVHVSGTINASAGRVGGFAGLIQSSNGVSKSSFVGTVTGGVSSSGGFTGYAVNTTISDSYARATVNGGSYAVGGFVGETGNCCTYLLRNYAVGDVTGQGGDVGGFVGYAEGGSDVVFANNFAATTVSGGSNHGAFMGRRQSTVTITNNYYDSTANGSDSCIASGAEVGDGCTGASSAGFYFLLPTSAPMTQWNFTNVWHQEDGDYPTLIPIDAISTPAEPQNVTAQVNGLNPDFTWEVPLSDGGLPISSYRIQVKLSTANWDNPLALEATTTSLSYDDNDNKLDYDQTYDVRISAENWLGYGEYSNPVQFTVGNSTVHEISSCAQLQAMDTEADTYTHTFNLTQNIDCSGIPNFRALGNGGWNNTFRGVFDGRGYTISNLTINLPEEGDVGLFKMTDRATIKNVTLHTGSVTGFYEVGALVGYAYHTTISNVRSDLAVNGLYNPNYGWGGNDVGGLVGYMDSDGATIHSSSISNSSSSGVVSGNSKVGGIVGYLYSYPDEEGYSVLTSLTNNSFTGTVAGDSAHGGSDVGGIIGEVELDGDQDDDTTINLTVSGNTVTSGNIYGTENVGGLIGYIDSYTYYNNDVNNITIANNRVSAEVEATDSAAGGLIGYMYHSMDDDDESFHFTVNGNSVEGVIASGGYYAGGLIGYQNISTYGDDSTAYITITANRSLASVGSGSYSGGLVGYIGNYRDGSGEFINTMSENYATGSVGANGGYVGGLIGSTYIGNHTLNITNSYFNGTLGSTGGVGGIIGVSGAGNSGTVFIAEVYAAGSVAAYANGGDAGGLVGRNDEGSLYIYNSFVANTMVADHAKGSVVGSNNMGATLVFGEVYYDEEKNSLGCVDDQSASDCTAVNTIADPDTAYFFNNATKPVFASGEGSWNFTDIWSTVTDSYPVLRTTFEITDVTAPIITEVKSIAAQTTIANATYKFTVSEVCTPFAYPIQSSVSDSAELHISDITDSNTEQTAYVSGLKVGGTYSFSFGCRDANNNDSNTVMVGPFTVIDTSTGGGSSSGSYRGVGQAWSSQPVNDPVKNTQPTTTVQRTLKQGLKGADVKLLQQALNKKGFIIAKTGAGSPGKESTLFGVKTKLAVVRFQKQNKLKTDGVVGPKTWALISK
ncbi:MAG: peptidoglycan-binding protein [bacterium]